MTEIADDPIAAARAAGLRYTPDTTPGITRRRAGKGWSYLDYLRDIGGEEFTAKDLRTWAGTVLAARSLRDLAPFPSETAIKANNAAATDTVAARLGNTRAVCRSSSIHPAILLGYEDRSLCLFACAGNGDPGLDPDEQWALAYLNEAGEPVSRCVETVAPIEH